MGWGKARRLDADVKKMELGAQGAIKAQPEDPYSLKAPWQARGEVERFRRDS